MDRRDFIQLGGTAVLGSALMPAWSVFAAPGTATVLFDDRVVTLDVDLDPAAPESLWIRKSDLPQINGFEIKPEGACRADICIPLPPALSRGDRFDLTGFAKRIRQAAVVDEDARAWSFGEIAMFQSGLLTSRVAPDFAVPDREGRIVRLSDFRGKKVLVLTWASWCGCRQDLKAWQEVYQGLKGRNFEIVAAAEDTAGEAVAGRWYDVAKVTFPSLIDRTHAVASAFQFMNVPAGAWIDEQGKIVRPGEPAWASDQVYDFGVKKVTAEGEVYVAALRDWVAQGWKSRYALGDKEYAARVKGRSPAHMEAEAAFKLGVWFQEAGRADRAQHYFERAQRLNPDDWNYHRQAWSFTPAESGKKWLQRFQATDGEYYPTDPTLTR
ncbi:MAG: redoxin domain-containing protein [Acidimicrobiia bacterium]|nr:redoxin domain-containing protein [Acidimicrobiia bacterium]